MNHYLSFHRFKASIALLLALSLPALADDDYFYSGGKKHVLKPATDWIGVELTAGVQTEMVAKQVLDSGLLRKEQSAVTHTQKQIMVLPVTPGETGKAKTAVTAGVKRPVRVFKNGNIDPIVETDDILVRFKPGVTRARAEALLAAKGVEIVREIGGFSPNGYLARVKNGRPATDVANEIHETPEAVWSHPDLIWPMVSRFVPDDTLYTQQWHLNNTGGSGGIAGADIKAERAWEFTRGDSNIIIAIVDDGVNTGHEDFASPGKIVTGWDFVGNDNDARPGAGQNHGTACAGLAAADGNNSLGVSGVAPNCRIMPIRLLGPNGSFSKEAAAITFAKDNGADIISNSWGPVDGTGASTPCPDVVNDAINDAADNGRGGKGCIITWAAGNGNESSDLDGYASHPRVLCVAATLRNDTRSPYSDFGLGVDICAPGGSQAGDIVTADRMGAVGYTGTNYTAGFNGTSAATPIVSGAAALLLSMEPNLTRAEVHQRLIDGADFIDTANATYDANGHNNNYGFGRLNIWATLGSNDDNAPFVTITNISNGTTYTALYAVAGSAGDSHSGVYRVECAVVNRNTNLWWQETTGAWVANSNDAMQKVTAENGVWAADLPGMGEGNFEIHVKSEDKAGNFSNWVTTQYNIDNGAPTLTISQPLAGTITSSPSAISGVAGDTGTGVKEIRVALRDSAGSRWWNWLAGGWGGPTFVWNENAAIASGTTSWSRPLPSLAEGSYEVFAQALDNADEASEWKPRSFLYDSGNPVVTFGSLVDQNPVFDFSILGGTVSEPATITWRLIEFNMSGGDRYWTGTDWTTNIGDPAVWRPASVTGNGWKAGGATPGRLSTRPGPYIATARAVDRAGRLVETSINLVRTATDTTPPDLWFNTPSAGTVVTTSALPLLSGIAGDSQSGIASLGAYLMRHAAGNFYYWNGSVWTLTPTVLPLAHNIGSGLWQAPLSTGINAWSLPHDRDLVNGPWQLQVTATNGELPAATRQASIAFTVDYYPVYTWTGGSTTDSDPYNDDSDWDNPDNWEPYAIPGPGDIVVIENGQVDSAVSRTVRAIRMQGGMLNFTSGPGALGTLAITGPSTWSNGTISGTLSVPAGVTLAVTPGAQRMLGASGVIENRGVVTQDATAPVTGYNTVRIENKFGGVWRINGEGDPFDNYYGGNTFRNEGLIEKTGAGTVTLNDWLFDMPNETRSSAGILDFASESLFPSGALLSGAATIWWSGHEDLQGVVTQNAAFLKLMTGTLTCSANATLIGTWDWEGGTIDNTIRVLNGSILRIQGPAGRTLGTGAVLANEGTVRWIGPGAITGHGSSTITNAAGARFEIMNGGDLFDNWNGGNVFQNDGLLVKVSGSAASIFNDWAFNSPGELKTEFGPLEVNAPLTLPSGAILSGAGMQKWLSDTVTLTGTVTLSCPLEVDGAVINATGPGILTNDWTWKSGYLNGQFNIPAGKRLTVQGAGAHILDTDTIINNFGIMKWEGPAPVTGWGGITWNNKPGSRITLNADGEPFANYNGANVLVNESTINKSGGGGIATVNSWELRNRDEIRADTGGLDFTGEVHWLAGTRLRGPGTIRQRGRTFLDAPTVLEAPVQFYEGVLTADPAASIAGTLEWRSGNLEGTCRILSGATLRIVAGDKILTDSSIIQNSGTVDWQSGDLTGYGSVLLDNLSGSTFRTSSSGSLVVYNGGNKIRVASGAQMLKTGAGTTHIDWAVDNNGVCEVQQGTLSLEDGGSSAGAFTTAADATLTFAADEFRLKNGASVSGAGTNQVTDAMVLAEGAASGHFNLLGTGTLGHTGAGVMTLTGTNRWTQGYLEGGVTVAAGATLTIAAANLKQLNSFAVLTNRGTVEIQSGAVVLGYGSASLRNLAGATLRIAPGATFTDYNGSNAFINDGTLELTGTGTVTSPWEFTQSATGTLRVPIAAAGPGLTSGVLESSISALAGNFIAVVPAGLTPPLNAEFFPLTYSSQSGAFASVLASTGGAWQATYEAGRVKIRVPGGGALTFGSWASAAGLSGADALPNADPDKDGQTNFSEYAFNTSPVASSPAPVSAAVATIGGQQWLAINYRRWADREAAGLTYTPQGSGSLSGWNSSGIVDEVDPAAPVIPGSTACRCRVPVGGPQKYLRIMAAKP